MNSPFAYLHTFGGHTGFLLLLGRSCLQKYAILSDFILLTWPLHSLLLCLLHLTTASIPDFSLIDLLVCLSLNVTPEILLKIFISTVLSLVLSDSGHLNGLLLDFCMEISMNGDFNSEIFEAHWLLNADAF